MIRNNSDSVILIIKTEYCSTRWTRNPPKKGLYHNCIPVIPNIYVPIDKAIFMFLKYPCTMPTETLELQYHLVIGRDNGSGWSSHRQNPASLGFSDKNVGGRILWRRSNIAAACAFSELKRPSNWKEKTKKTVKGSIPSHKRG